MPLVLEGNQVHISATIGISISPWDGDTSAALIRNAEHAMHRAKELGRSRIQHFTPEMRESDDETVRRACVFVDTREGAVKEGGDIVMPLRAGVITERSVLGDLYDLTRGKVPGRKTSSEITLFKSVGAALEDLAAGILVFQKAELGVKG